MLDPIWVSKVNMQTITLAFILQYVVWLVPLRLFFLFVKRFWNQRKWEKVKVQSTTNQKGDNSGSSPQGPSYSFLLGLLHAACVIK